MGRRRPSPSSHVPILSLGAAALPGAEVYLAALDAEPWTSTPPAERMPASAPAQKPVAAVATSPAPEASEPSQLAGPLYEAMKPVCADCARQIHAMWGVVRMTVILTRMDIGTIDVIERAIGRMAAYEHQNRLVRRDHIRSFEIVLANTLARGDDTGGSATLVLHAVEICGISFSDCLEFRVFYQGLRQRIHSDGEPGFQENCRRLFDRMLPHVSRLTGAQRAALARAETLLHGIDLFAEGGGAVPFFTCLRIAIAAARRNLSRAEIHCLWHIYTSARAGDLRAFLEDTRTSARNVEHAITSA